MKHMKTIVLFLTIFCVFFSCFSVTADRYDWTDGVLPEDWQQIMYEEDVTANGILKPVNPNASQEARNLYTYLCTIMESDSFLTGLFDMNANNSMYEQVQREFGVQPALYSTHYAVKSLGFSDVNNLNDPYYKKENGGIYVEEGRSQAVIPQDLMTFTDADKINALAKQHYDNGNIVLLHSDEGARKLCAAVVIAKGKYTDAADAIIELDATNPDRDLQAYALWCRFQENQAEALRQLEASGVKAYLLRYWIEFNYENFHGLTFEGQSAFVRVFQQTTQNLIDAGLTGFLVTYSPGTGGNTITRNPGNDYVDCYGVTLYSPDTDLGHIDAVGFANYDWYVKTGKPISFTEFSCRTGIWADVAGQARASSFDLLLDAATAYPRLTFVNFWGDGAYSIINNETDMLDGNDDGRLFLDSPFTLELSEIMDYRTVSLPAPGVAQVGLSTDDSGVYHGLEERVYSLSDLRAMGIEPTAVNAVRANSDYAVIFYEGDKATGKEHRYVGANKNIPSKVAATFRSCRVLAMSNVALGQSEIYASANDDAAWKANDGFASFWSGQTDKHGVAWMYVDLGQPHIVNHYVVKSAGVSGISDVYNLRDFAFQYSMDGETWETAATVVNNTLSTMHASIDPVVGQYFRLYITKANSYMGDNAEEKMTAMIAEYELFGIPYLDAQVDEPEPTTTTKKPTTTTKKVTTTTKKTTKKTTTTTALKLATPKVTVSNATKGVKVSWGKVSKADKYYVYRKTRSGSWSKIKTTTSVSYTDESAKAGKSYQYMVKAVKGSVTSGYKAVSITRLSVPKVTVSNASKGVKVSWGKVTGASKYTVYRKTGSGSWSKIKTTTSTSYTDTKASAGKSYQYMVKAVKGDYTSYYKAASIRFLKAPGSIKLAKATKGFKASWSKVTGATKYEVYRKTGNGSYTKIATTTKTAYTDKTAKKGKYYTYRVRAVYSSYKSVFKTGGKVKR